MALTIVVLVAFGTLVAERQLFHRKEAGPAEAPLPTSFLFVKLVDYMVHEVFSADPEGRIAGLQLTPDGRHVRWLTDDALSSARSVCSGRLCDRIKSEQNWRKRVRAMTHRELAKLLEQSCAGDIGVRCETGLREQNRRKALGKSLSEGGAPTASRSAYPIPTLSVAMAAELIASHPEGRIAGLQFSPDGRHLTWLTDDALDAGRKVCTDAVCKQIQLEQEARDQVRSLATEDLEKQLQAACAGASSRLCDAGLRELHRREVAAKFRR